MATLLILLGFGIISACVLCIGILGFFGTEIINVLLQSVSKG